MGQSMPVIFRWPPCRPSFMPPAHFQDHEQSKACREMSWGRRGDEEILEMWKRARQSPENYTRIPTVNTMRSLRTSMVEGKGMQTAEEAAAAAQNGLYGPPPSSAEQKRFGAEMDMP